MYIYFGTLFFTDFGNVYASAYLLENPTVIVLRERFWTISRNVGQCIFMVRLSIGLKKAGPYIKHNNI